MRERNLTVTLGLAAGNSSATAVCNTAPKNHTRNQNKRKTKHNTAAIKVFEADPTQSPAHRSGEATHRSGEAEAGGRGGRALLQCAVQLLALGPSEATERSSHGHGDGGAAIPLATVAQSVHLHAATQEVHRSDAGLLVTTTQCGLAGDCAPLCYMRRTRAAAPGGGGDGLPMSMNPY